MFYEQKRQGHLTGWLKKKRTDFLRNCCEGFVDRLYIFAPLLKHFFDNL